MTKRVKISKLNFIFIKHVYIIEQTIDFTKATIKSAFLGDTIGLICNTTSIDASLIIWLVTQNKIGLYQVEPSDRYNIKSDGRLDISGLESVDEEYYVCGYLNSKNNFVTRSTYVVFIKGINYLSLNWNG
jgi:hypothetical protein